MLPVSKDGLEKATWTSIKQKDKIYKCLKPNNCLIQEYLFCPKPNNWLIQESHLLTHGDDIGL